MDQDKRTPRRSLYAWLGRVLVVTVAAAAWIGLRRAGLDEVETTPIVVLAACGAAFAVECLSGNRWAASEPQDDVPTRRPARVGVAVVALSIGLVVAAIVEQTAGVVIALAGLCYLLYLMYGGILR